MHRANDDYLKGRAPTSLCTLLFVALCVMMSSSVHGYGGLTVPVFHSSRISPPSALPAAHLASMRGKGLLAEINNMAIPSSPAGNPLHFPVVTLDEALGEYFAVMEIGTPAQKAAVAIDTGSQLLWVQCKPCLQCAQQSPHYPIFKPAQSSSYAALTCADCRGDESVATACTSAASAAAWSAGSSTRSRLLNQSDRCIYYVSYGDRSSSTGFISTETLSLAGVPRDEVVFGCGLITMGLVSTLNASGLLGLDRGRLSIISQLGIKAFSYCLPNRVKNVHASGYLTLGPLSLAARSTTQLRYTPLLQNHASQFLSQFYYLNMTGISINGKVLSIPTSAFRLLPSGQGGTIIDSGTSITRFVHVAYTSLSHAFDMAMDPSLKRINLGDVAPSLCYQVPLWQSKVPPTPKVTLHLSNNVDLHLQSHHVLAYMGSDSSSSYYCLAFMDSGNDPDAKNFFGNYQQQDFLIEYDLANSQIGFAPVICNQSILWKPSHTSLIWLVVFILHLKNNLLLS